MHWYNMAAKEFGVDPKDEGAVEDFFVKTFATLSKGEQEKVLKFLLGHDGPARVPADCDCSSCVKRREGLKNEQ